MDSKQTLRLQALSIHGGANTQIILMNTFTELGISQTLLKAVEELGFQVPTPIQAQAIPFLLTEKRDLLGFAQTGTGKTAAFGLPIIQQIDLSSGITQAIILSPTRELCVQITNDLKNYSKYEKGINVVAVYGGASAELQIKALRKGAQIVVGTPGRVLDLINRKALKIDNVNFLVLDEADEMLSMGFKDELDSILAETPEEKQTLLFSATMPREISDIARKYMHNPEEIEVSRRNTGAETLKHHYYSVMAKDKYLCLKRICDIYPNIYGIVFCQTRTDTKEVAEKLIHDGYNADALHGDLSQAQRDMVMQRFRIRNLQILVATDVAARGLDVSDVSHIINYSLPMEAEVYIHRSGRTGRAGKSGISISIAHSREFSKLRQIEKLVGQKFEHKKVPTGREICEKQLFNVIDKLENIEVDEKQIEQFLPAVYSKLSWLSREELIKRFVSEEFSRFANYYKDATDISIPDPIDRNEGKSRREVERERRNNRNGDTSFARIYINVGSNNRVNPTSIIGIINDAPDLRNAEVGRIEIMKKCTFFEIDRRYEHLIGAALSGKSFDGVALIAETAIPKSETGDGSAFKAKRSKSYGESPNYGQRRDRSASESDRGFSKRNDAPKAESGFGPVKKKWKEVADTNWQKDKKASLKGKKEKKSDKKSSSKGPKKERKSWFD